MTDGNDMAYPASDKYNLIAELGLTKREYFAAMAMQSFAKLNENFDACAFNSVKYADALINELNKEKQ